MEDAINLLFGGMQKLGPGSDEDTRHMLRLLPKRSFRTVVDAGCGAGRQTLVLAKELDTPIHAVDTHEAFLIELQQRAKRANLDPLIETHCLDMNEIPNRFREIDLLWSEGAAYNIGFAHALQTWATAIQPGGFVGVSELCWLAPEPPAIAKNFFQTGYPDMRSVDATAKIATAAGYQVLATHILPRRAWTEGYYDVLKPRAAALIDHTDETACSFAAETLREIEVFEQSGDSYGYAFFLLQK